MENKILKKLPLSIKEMLNDAFALDIITEIIRSIDNRGVKKYLGDYLLFFGSIFTGEIIKAELGDKQKVPEETLKIINELRMKNLKYSPTIDSEYISEKVKEMGIDFDYYVFDTIITVDKQEELYDINFRTWEYANLEEEYFSKLNQIAITASSWNKKMLLDNIPYLKTYEELIVLFLKERLKSIYLNYKSYASSKLFNTEINKEEKLYIAQRYGLAKSILFMDMLMRDIPVIDIGIMKIDVKMFLRKNKAVLFGIMWNDYKNTKFNIIEKIFEKNRERIPNEFYPISTKIRNNLHYKTTNIITEDELKIFDSNQEYYTNNILNVFNNNILVKFNFGYKFALLLAKLEYWSRNEKDRRM